MNYKKVTAIIVISLIFLSFLPSAIKIVPELKLHGVQKTVDKPSIGLKQFLTGDFQKKYEEWLSQNYPLRSYYIRMYSQLIYSFFNKSSVKSIVIGKKGYLYEPWYIYSYLKLYPRYPVNGREIEAKVRIIKYIQEYFRKNKRTCIIIITPNKAALYPEYIPDSYSRENISLKSDYDNFIKLLDNEKVEYLDFFKLLEGYKNSKKYSCEFFPKGGTHWNSLGSFLASQELLRKIKSKIDVPTIEIEEITFTNKTQMPDYDLMKILGLATPFYRYSNPVVKIRVENKNFNKNEIIFQGGSFLGMMCNLFDTNKIFSKIDYFFYIQHLIKFPTREVIPFSKIKEIDFENIKKSEIFILEVNQEYIWKMGSGFIEELYNEIKE